MAEALSGLGAGEALELGEIDDLVGDAHLLVESAFFGHIAYAADILVGYRRAIEEDLTAVGLDDAIDDADEGGLASAVGAEEAEDRAFGDVEADLFKSFEGAKGFGDVIYLEFHGFC
jgi:hypothetical protein